MSGIRLPGRLVLRAVTLAALALVTSSGPAFAAETYVRATVDKDGQLRILTAGGRTLLPVKERGQVEFAQPLLSPDGAAVGWLAEYPNSSTSYPIPLKLLIHTSSGLRTFVGSGLPVWRWGFQVGGTWVAFQQETVHGGFAVHYELRDLASGCLLAAYEPAVGPDNRVLPAQRVPPWVAALDAGR